MDCWHSSCSSCANKLATELNQIAQNTASPSTVSWYVWKQSTSANRTEKCKESGSLDKLVAHVISLWPKFIRHSFAKREQSTIFDMHDRRRALSGEFPEEGLLQIDFAENFVCENQDEVQNAHWNQRQLSLFTSGFHFNGTFEGKVFVSNNLCHTKDTIVTYLWKLISTVPASLKILKIWSDGPSSQFKNKFMAALIERLEDCFKIKIYWNYFAASHGKGCVDGIGATAKIVVRKHIKARNAIVNSASDFVAAFNLTNSEIKVIEIPNDEFDQVNNKLQVSELFSSCKNIRNISNSHQIQVINGKIVTFYTSKEGYNLA